MLKVTFTSDVGTLVAYLGVLNTCALLCENLFMFDKDIQPDHEKERTLGRLDEQTNGWLDFNMPIFTQTRLIKYEEKVIEEDEDVDYRELV